MNYVPKWDLISSPNLALKDGKLETVQSPGLGFAGDGDNVARVAKMFADTNPI